MTVTASVEAGLGRLVIANPPLNILTRDLLATLRAGLRRVGGEPAVRALLLTAEGRHFSAGADVGEHLPPHHLVLIPEFLETVSLLDEFPVPVIAAVQGRCLGAGFELVLAADLIVAAETARFGQPEILLGVLPPAACALLPDWLPRGPAAEIVFTGDPLDADEARRLGLVRQVVGEQELEQRALALAARITRHSTAALRAAKAALRAGRPGRGPAIERAGRIYLDELMRSADPVEGLRAFVEKRSPVWSHR